jgi:sulfur relay (sulfurtransferase) DsrF/TusC family protein
VCTVSAQLRALDAFYFKDGKKHNPVRRGRELFDAALATKNMKVRYGAVLSSNTSYAVIKGIDPTSVPA